MLRSIPLTAASYATPCSLLELVHLLCQRIVILTDTTRHWGTARTTGTGVSLRVPTKVDFVRVGADFEHRLRSWVDRVRLRIGRAGTDIGRSTTVGEAVRLRLRLSEFLSAGACPTLSLRPLQLRICTRPAAAACSDASVVDRIFFSLRRCDLTGLQRLSRTLGLTEEVGRMTAGALSCRGLRIRVRVIDEGGRFWYGVPSPVIADEALHISLNFELLERKTELLAGLHNAF